MNAEKPLFETNTKTCYMNTLVREGVVIVSWDRPSTVDRTGIRSRCGVLFSLNSEDQSPAHNVQRGHPATGGHHHHSADNTCPWNQPQRSPVVFACLFFTESSEFNFDCIPSPQNIHTQKAVVKILTLVSLFPRTSCNRFAYLREASVFRGERAHPNFNPGQHSGVSPSSGGVNLPSLTQPKSWESATTHQEPTPMR